MYKPSPAVAEADKASFNVIAILIACSPAVAFKFTKRWGRLTLTSANPTRCYRFDLKPLQVNT